MPVNLFDVILVLPIVAMGLKGLKNGLIHEFLTLTGTFFAIFISFTYMDDLGNVLAFYSGSSSAWVPVISFVMIYFVAIVLLNIVIKALNAFITFAHLSTLNLLTGSLFSAYKGALILSVILLFMAGFNLPKDDVKNDSLLYPYVFPVAPMSYDFVAKIYPGVDSFAEQAGTFIDKFNPFTDFHPKDDN